VLNLSVDAFFAAAALPITSLKSVIKNIVDETYILLYIREDKGSNNA